MSGGAPAPVEIHYDGDDITDLCSIKESVFVSRAGGITPGECTIVFRDTRQKYRFVAGKTLELFIDGERAWDGWLMSRGFNYWFATHTVNCEPCPHVTPRKLILRGADRNLLFTRRVLYNIADPSVAERPYWPADTPDEEVLLDSFDQFLNQIDGLDYTSGIEFVGSPDPFVEFQVPGPTSFWGDLMREVAQSTGAVFYIDPDRKVIYTDVNEPNAPYAVSDRPSGAQVGYRDFELMNDASNMVNDAMIWGAGQGADHIVFDRVQDTASINAHGRWQNTGGFRHNLWKQESVNRSAYTIVYGSPSSKRGHKDDKVTARFTVFEPGLRVAQKISIESEVHGWSDVMPIREMTIRFHNQTQAEYAIVAGHEIDEPWTTSEYWFPELDFTPREDPPRRDCSYYRTEDSGIVLLGLELTTDPDSEAEGVGSHVSTWGQARNWDVYIFSGDAFPDNKWIWRGNNTVDTCGGVSNNDLRAVHQLWFGDLFWYTFGDAGLQTPGQRYWHWQTTYQRYDAPAANSRWPGSGFYLKITGTININTLEGPREMEGGGIFGPHEIGEHAMTEPMLIQLLFLRAGNQCHAPRVIAPALVEAMMLDGDSLPFTSIVHVEEKEAFHLGLQIFEPKPTEPIIQEIDVTCNDIALEWTAAKPSGWLVIGPWDPEPCVEVPLYGDYCGDALRLTDTLYRTPSPYVAGSTKVYVSGIHQIPGVDYEETDPDVGRFTFDSEPTGSVTACYVATGVWEPSLPDTSTKLFVIPTTGSISATFGAQSSLWAGAFWHGTWYEHFHNGVDFSVVSGTPVYAAAAGKVVYEDQAAGGTMIHIYHPFHGMRTTYAHLSGRVVANYSEVTQGQLIAYSGASGQVTGAHLHWGLVINGSPENPLPYADYSLLPPDEVLP